MVAEDFLEGFSVDVINMAVNHLRLLLKILRMVNSARQVLVHPGLDLLEDLVKWEVMDNVETRTEEGLVSGEAVKVAGTNMVDLSDEAEVHHLLEGNHHLLEANHHLLEANHHLGMAVDLDEVEEVDHPLRDKNRSNYNAPGAWVDIADEVTEVIVRHHVLHPEKEDIPLDLIDDITIDTAVKCL
ncbi:hypothetical protein Ddc_08299 [Ditylenchus destructor]|nr:hypothetical protein Ddc_08299 [Ditylenchus destructor]